MGILSKAFGDEYDHQSIGSQSAETVAALRAAYPQLFDIINQGKLTDAQGDLATARAVTPGYNDLALSELERNQPRISSVQGAMDRGQATADIANLNANGVAAGTSMRATDTAANPEFYDTLATLGGKYGEVLGNASPDVTAGERAEMERGLARMNPYTADNSQVQLAEKASEFGEAKNNKLARFAEIVNSVTAALPNLKTGLNPINLALGRDSRSAPTAGAVQTAVLPTGNATKVGTGLFENLAGTQSGINQMKAGAFKTWGDALLQDSQSFSNIASGASSIAGV